MWDGHTSPCFHLPLDPQRFHAAGELGADGDVLGPRSLAGAAADALAGAPVAVLGEEPALLAQRRTLVAVDREVVRARERA